MGLVPGECIRAVNGLKVSNEKELYDAIQINAAHCRLQVIGRDGEVRLMQQVIFRHDHHAWTACRPVKRSLWKECLNMDYLKQN